MRFPWGAPPQRPFPVRRRIFVNGAVVSGATAEFFGDGADPQGAGMLARAEFFVDDLVTPVYVDTTPGGHYHVGGGHALWDTTALSDGPHVLRMTVYDSGGLSGSHQITVTVSNNPGPPAGGGRRSGDEGCGATGMEVLLVLASVLVLRRRK
ncbi:MAG: hypothetical protein ACRDKW_03230 [Actinomycetota bacterium]